MTEKRFESYFDNHMGDWKVQDILTLDIYPCVSQKVAEAFAELLNGLYCSDLKLLKSNDFLLKENEQLKEENKELKKQLEREETDKKRLMSYLMRYKGFGFDEIVEDYFNEPSYDNWWEDGFYEFCWNEYLQEKGFDGCDD